jgi:hypothetical protein
MNCIICGKEFFPKRFDAKTCSPKCRRLVWYKKPKTCPNCGWKKGDAITGIVVNEGCEQTAQ